MWKRHLLVLGAAAVGAGILTAFWISAAPEPTAAPVVAPEPEAISAPLVTIVDPAKGPRDAEATIIEYGDHSCPYCRATQEAVDALMAQHPGKVRFVWKSAPSPVHPGTDIAAEGAMCAMRQGKFWEYHARLFELGTYDQTSLALLADELDLDLDAFGACISSRAARPLVERTVTEAKALGLTGIPTIFVNGTRYEGALTHEQLLEATGL
jgi:protein-disulfide isomerase